MSTSWVDVILPYIPTNNRIERIWKLAKIDFKKRYYNSYLGLIWAFLNPVLKIAIYYTVFTVIFQNSIENFAFYIFIGFLFWMAFTEGTNKSFRLFKSKGYLIENIQLNKIDLFISASLSVMFGFAFNLLAFVVISSLAGIYMTLYIFWLPLIILNLLLVLLGTSLILASIKVFIKDVDMVWSIVLLAGFWATPIFHDSVRLFQVAPWMKWVNPMAGIIVNARDVLMYSRNPDLTLLAYNFIFGIFLILLGQLALKKFGIYAIEKQ